MSSLIEQQTPSCNLCTLSWVDRDPRVLQCLHTFCCRCLEIYVKKKSKNLCPICQQKFKLPRKGVKGLPKNIFFCDNSADSDIISTISFCGKHNDEISLVCYEERCKYKKLCVKCIHSHEGHKIKPYEDHRQINEGLKLEVKNLIKSAKTKVSASAKDLDTELLKQTEQLIKSIQNHSLQLRQQSSSFYNNKIQFLDDINAMLEKCDSPDEIEEYQSLLNEMHYRQERYAWKPLIFSFKGYDGKFGDLENNEIYSDKESLSSGDSDMFFQKTYEALWESKLYLKSNGLKYQREVKSSNRKENKYQTTDDIEAALQMAGDLPPPLPKRRTPKNENDNKVKSPASILQKFKSKLNFPNISNFSSQNKSPPSQSNAQSDPEPIPTYNDEYDFDYEGPDYWADAQLNNSNTTVPEKRKLPAPPVPARRNHDETEYNDLSLYVNERKEEESQAPTKTEIPSRNVSKNSLSSENSTSYPKPPPPIPKRPSKQVSNNGVSLTESLANALRERELQNQNLAETSTPVIPSPTQPFSRTSTNLDSEEKYVTENTYDNDSVFNQSSNSAFDLNSHPLFRKAMQN